VKQYKGVIFDLDGTLVDSFPGIHQSLARAMAAVGVPPWDLEQTRQNVGHGIDHLLETAVGTEKKKRALQQFKADYVDTCQEKTFLLPGVREGLDAMETAGLRLAVATNKPLTFTRLILNRLNINTCFSCVMAPDRVRYPKPHPDMIRAIRNELHLEAAACLYVGDMPLDAETASRAGVDCLLLATGATPFHEMKKGVQVPVLRGFSDILPFLGGG
jgi:phosphoglycolate phosphatase